MYVDTKREGEVQKKADPYLLDNLIAWLEKQPPEKEYPFYDIEGGCLYAQYHTSLGIAWDEKYYVESILAFGSELAACDPWTFGAALDRAKALEKK